MNPQIYQNFHLLMIKGLDEIIEGLTLKSLVLFSQEGNTATQMFYFPRNLILIFSKTKLRYNDWKLMFFGQAEYDVFFLKMLPYLICRKMESKIFVEKNDT